MIDIETTISLRGYDPLMLKPHSGKKIWSICDHCGYGRWIVYQHYASLCRKCAAKIPERRKKQSESRIKYCAKEKNPLPIGRKITIPENKNCAAYLGLLAEELLAQTFKDVKRMPAGNHGYDIICNRGLKIDVKSSALGYKGFWIFGIRKNQVADHFLCIGFEDRNNLNPIHLWLIPGKVINHKYEIRISKSRLDRWSEYEQPLNRVLTCCNNMRN